jgi:lipopolysaccharide biosynthesis protein
MSFTTINQVNSDGLIAQYDVFDTQEDADARLAELHQMAGYEDAFVVDNSATAVNGEMCFQNKSHWVADKENKTVRFDQSAYDATMLTKHMSRLRAERNQRLLASDVDVLPDRWAAMNDDTKTAWSNYRQALRDLPVNTADPTNVTWPTKPE